ncbi:hypothetical protein C7M47_03123 (plasmid) [Lactiplantibacillus plantarum]|nr:hypothetical protein [Lactiplantibacillus plantarum]QHM64158.1 hypothetical protein C7M47_03123 [Lactiplantibacillus plantarum]
MSEFKGLLLGMLIVAILYVLDRYLPKMVWSDSWNCFSVINGLYHLY